MISVTIRELIGVKDHRLIDERSLEFGRVIAEKLRHQPELLELAKSNLVRWLGTSSANSRPALEEWLTVLNGPMEQVRALLVGDDERAKRLRQSNPFAGALSQQERNAILMRYQAYDASRT
jgi:hypothetical protein